MKNVITLIEACKKNKDRVNIYINDNFSFSCSAELVYLKGLKKGIEVSIEELNEVVKEDNYIKCKNAALKIIEKTYKTEKELKDKLLSKEFDEITIEKTIKFLKEYKFIDDEKYCNEYIKEKIKCNGKNKIKYALIKKGIDENIIENYINSVIGEEEFARKQGEKKLKLLINSGNDKIKVKNKLYAFLMSKGYESSLCVKIVKTLVENVDFEGGAKEEEFNEQGENELNKIYDMAYKKYNILKNRESDKAKLYKKLGEFLVRKGFSYDEVKTVLKEVLKED